MAKSLTPMESFLAPLAKLAAKYPALEGEVIWAAASEWQSQDDDTEFLDVEEVPFYAEGLLMEGFKLYYQVLAEATATKEPAHIRLFFWQSNPPALPEAEEGLTVIAANIWAD